MEPNASAGGFKARHPLCPQSGNESGKHVTRDLGGTADTAEFTQAVIEELR